MSWDRNTDFLVIVNHYDADVSWTQQLKLPYVIYEKNQPEKEPYNAVNRAKSETNLLKFIFDFYDRLPRNIITVHQYERKYYHQGSLVDILNDPQLPERYAQSKTPGHLSLNSAGQWEVGASQIARMIQSGWWDATMQPYFGAVEQYDNFMDRKMAGSQFIVSRERILSLPVEFYRKMYWWLVENTLASSSEVKRDPIYNCRVATTLDHHPNSEWNTSRYMEWSWELIFVAIKEWEKPYHSLSDKYRIYVLYGAKGYFGDKTSIFLTQFVRRHEGGTGYRVVIPVDVKFNDILGDILTGTVKQLVIVINDVRYLIAEERRDIIDIELL